MITLTRKNMQRKRAGENRMKKRITKTIGMLCCLLCFVMISMIPQKVSANTGARVLVTDYEIDGEVEPGKNVTLRVNIRNVSLTHPATSIVGYLYFPNGGVYMQDGYSNEVYCAQLTPGEGTTLEYYLTLDDLYTEDMALLQLDLDYMSNNSAHVTTAHITPTITQDAQLDIELLTAAESVEEGTELIISTRYENIGTKDIDNIVMHVTGSVKEGNQEIPLLELEAGETVTKEVSVLVNGSGMQTIHVSFSYVDEFGNNYKTDPKEFQIEVVRAGTYHSESKIINFFSGLANPFYIFLILVAAGCVWLCVKFVQNEIDGRRKGDKK